MGMNLHTVVVSYNRRDLTTAAIASYFGTVTGPFSLTVVDNGSDKETVAVLRELERFYNLTVLYLGENKYPGYACNRGWELAPPDTALLHRADNDFTYIEDWETHARLRFSTDEKLGQLGLRTDEEELFNSHNVGGNCIVRKALWDEGLRYDERPWPKIAKKVPGYTEDSFLSPQVRKMGWEWGRVTQPCIRPISSEDPNDEYYRKSWADRGIWA